MKASLPCGRFAFRPRVSLPLRAAVGAIAWLLATACRGDLPDAPPPAAAIAARDSAPVAASSAATTPDLWVVSTRHLPEIGCVPSAAAVAVERFAVNGVCGRLSASAIAA